MNQILPDPVHPYYIVANAYRNTSAGIKALHLLCHHLNKKGYPAYLVVLKDLWGNERVCPDLVTPLLTEEIIRLHFSHKRCPIVVYPETIYGNPLDAPLVARYVLHYPGLLGGETMYNPEEMVFTYSKHLARSIPDCNASILFLPTSDTRIFYPPKDNKKRKGTCFYASKYKNFHKAELKEINEKNSYEITRDKVDSPTTFEVAEILRRSELFYTYEDTALSIEAILCGCPAVFIPNDYLIGQPLGLEEIGNEGIAWDIDDSAINKAKATVHLAYDNYMQVVNNFDAQLINFINITQLNATTKDYTHSIEMAFIKFTKFYIINHFLKRAAYHYNKQGFAGLLSKSMQIGIKLARRLLK